MQPTRPGQKLATVIAMFTLAIPNSGAAQEKRATTRAFKGMELYSWKDKAGDWNFVLLEGTNRIKTEAEIKGAAGRITTAEKLLPALGRLAIGENVVWVAIKGCEYPPKEIRQKIEKGARSAKIDLGYASR